jgi:hypothetical protein
MSNRIGGIALAIGLMLFCEPAIAQFEHPDLKSGKIKPQKLLILPPQVEVVKVGVKSNEGLIEESQKVEAALPGIINSVFSDRGFSLVASPYTKEALQQDEETRYALADAQKQFDALFPQIARKPKDIRKGRFTMGDEVSRFASGADAIVFVRARGQLSTGGKRTFALLIGGPGLYDVFSVDLVMVDAQTGNVLYYARSFSTGNFVKEPDKMAKPIEGSHKNFFKCTKTDKKKAA